MMKCNDFIKELLNFKWQFEPAKENLEVDLKNNIDGKFSKVTNDFLLFINSFTLLANEDDNAWFIPLEDYLNKDEVEGFAWNEFEMESLEYAEDDSQVKVIKNFWNNHLPFFMSVKNGYTYIAVVLDGESKGSIVSGNEPEYENTTKIASSLNDFFDKYIKVLKGELEDPIFKILI
jgi:hypothetical protein